MRLVFNGKEKLRSLRNYGENPMARFHGRDLTATSRSWPTYHRDTGHRIAERSAVLRLQRQIFDNFVKQKTQLHPLRFVTLAFLVPKTLNQRRLWFWGPTQSAGDCIAWYGSADDLVFKCNCCRQPRVRL